MSDSPTIDLSEVFDVERVLVTDLRVGDKVIDTTGGHHTLTRVTRFKHIVRTVRDDGWVDTYPIKEPSAHFQGTRGATTTILRRPRLDTTNPTQEV